MAVQRNPTERQRNFLRLYFGEANYNGAEAIRLLDNSQDPNAAKKANKILSKPHIKRIVEEAIADREEIVCRFTEQFRYGSVIHVLDDKGMLDFKRLKSHPAGRCIQSMETTMTQDKSTGTTTVRHKVKMYNAQIAGDKLARIQKMYLNRPEDDLRTGLIELEEVENEIVTQARLISRELGTEFEVEYKELKAKFAHLALPESNLTETVQ